MISPTSVPQKFDIASANRPPANIPQAIEVTGSDGVQYIVSFRTNADRFDHMLEGPAIVVEQVDKGAAESWNPGKNAATYFGELRLPVLLGTANSLLSCPGFALLVSNWDPDPNSQAFVTVSVSSATHAQLDYGTEPAVDVSQEVSDKGHASFAAGEITCVAGEYDWFVLESRQRVVVYASVDGEFIGYDWKINEIALTEQKGLAKPANVPCRNYPPVPDGKMRLRPTVDIEYEILSAGQIALTNPNPGQGTFQVTVQVRMNARWAAKPFVAKIPVLFKGETLVMPQLNIDKIACSIKNLDFHKKTQHRVVLLPGDIWQHLSPEKINRGLVAMDTMTRAESSASPVYVAAERSLSDIIGRPEQRFKVHELDLPNR